MKSVDWHAILDSHPLFKSLDRQERKLLLSEAFSKEQKYREGSVILKQGETGNSLFLIGAGQCPSYCTGCTTKRSSSTPSGRVNCSARWR